jgi:signal peptidase II
MAAHDTAKPERTALPWLGVSVLVLLADQLSKLWVLRSLPEFRAVPVIDGFWNWYRTYNTGAAFSLLGDAGGWQQYLFSGFAIAISAALGWWLAKTPRDDWKTALPFALVIGGAIGNLLDRLQHGHVVDFIQWHWRDHYWPSFNVADSAIFVAAAILILGSVLQPRKA